MRLLNTKIETFIHFPYECTALEEYLEDMGKKGWMLKSIYENIFRFKRMEPKKLKYSVDIFNRKNNGSALEYREYCKAAGWKFVCESGKIQVFCSEEDKEPVSIQTDEHEKYKSVFKYSLCKLSWQLIIILSFIFNLYIQWGSSAPGLALSSNLSIFSSIALSIVICISSVRIINFIIWSIKAKKILRENDKLIYSNYKDVMRKSTLQKVYSLIMLVGMFGFIALDSDFGNGFIIVMVCMLFIPLIIDLGIKKFINRHEYSRKTNVVIRVSGITLIIIFTLMTLSAVTMNSLFNESHEDKNSKKPQLTLKDFGFDNSDSEPYDTHDESILAKREVYISKGFSTTIFESKYNWVIKFYENRLLVDLNKYGEKIKLEQTKLPKNIRVYSKGYASSDNLRFILFSDNKVIEVEKEFKTMNNDEFLDRVYEKVLVDK